MYRPYLQSFEQGQSKDDAIEYYGEHPGEFIR